MSTEGEKSKVNHHGSARGRNRVRRQYRRRWRHILTRQNIKLGHGIHSFSLAAGLTCPGKSKVCTRHCYADDGYFRQPSVQNSYTRNLRISKLRSFVERIISEIIARRSVRVVRIHTSGDFYSARYVQKWAMIARLCPNVTFYAYTRSWRIRRILKQLVLLARLPNIKLWFSCDQETGPPARKYRRIRLAYMQVDHNDLPPTGGDLVFRIAKLREKPVRKIALQMVCPVENGKTGHNTDCARCGICWNEEKS